MTPLSARVRSAAAATDAEGTTLAVRGKDGCSRILKAALGETESPRGTYGDIDSCKLCENNVAYCVSHANARGESENHAKPMATMAQVRYAR